MSNYEKEEESARGHELKLEELEDRVTPDVFFPDIIPLFPEEVN